MEMRKLHMGTVSYGYDSMDEVAHQLAMAFGSGNDLSRFQLLWSQCVDLLIMLHISGHGRQNSLQTGVQLATRGRRDMSSRVHDVVLSLALCHNVGNRF